MHVSLQVVGHREMMEMLTNYEYTIDVTSDASGAAETYGTEAGFGIISAEQVLRWIASNCQQACPGESQKVEVLETPKARFSSGFGHEPECNQLYFGYKWGKSNR